jgi:hypothetical protein
MSTRQAKIWIVLEAGQPLVAFRNEDAARDFAHSANEASHRLATIDPKKPPRWHNFIEVELRQTPKAGKI